MSQSFNCEYHKLEIDKICDEFDSEVNYGLTNDKIESAREKYGPNKLTPPQQQKSHCVGKFLYNQSTCLISIALILCIIGLTLVFNIPLLIFIVFILITIIIAAIFWYWMHTKQYETNDSFMTADKVTVIRNQAKNRLIVEGYIHQELKTESTVDDITDLLIKYCGSETKINAEELVPGDIVKIKAGDRIHADIRVIECSPNFSIDQSSLTGESDPVKKSAKVSDTIPTEAENLIFFGTNCVDGEARGIVLYIGDDTFIGKYARIMVNTENDGQFSISINKRRSQLSYCLCCISVIFFILLLTLNGMENSLIISICWLVVGVIMIIICGGFVLIMWKSEYDFLNKLPNEYGMNVRSMEIAEYLSVIDTLVIRSQDILIDDTDNEVRDGVNMAIRDCIELGIKLIITSDSSINQTNSMVADMQLENAEIINGTEIEIDDEKSICQLVKDKFNQSNMIVLSTVSSTVLFQIVCELQRSLDKCVCFVGGQLVNDAPVLKKSDIGIAVNEYSTGIGKEAADIVAYQASHTYLHSIIQSMQISKQFRQSIGYKLKKCK